ncbi:uncharacterized protein LOC113766788 [Coffea eugenioides]|uniref:uncharacterized protein LOC113766788 n=1 Tax=Coffea eugenioides TaxID=49369 RepID=UPI000F60561B|nr:uncharacterized protein LOC113766788 [Coffea eugenioides]
MESWSVIKKRKIEKNEGRGGERQLEWKEGVAFREARELRSLDLESRRINVDAQALPYFQARYRGGVSGANYLASVKDKGKGTETLKDKSAILQTGEPLEANANNFEENVALEVPLTDQFSNLEQVLQEPPVKQSMPLNNWSPPLDERVQAPFQNYGSASVRLK